MICKKCGKKEIVFLTKRSHYEFLADYHTGAAATHHHLASVAASDGHYDVAADHHAIAADHHYAAIAHHAALAKEYIAASGDAT